MATEEPTPDLTVSPFVPDNIKAISWILLSVLGSSAMAIAARQASYDIDSAMIVFLRFTATAMLLVLLMVIRPTPETKLRFSRPYLHLTRGLLMGVSALLGFYAIANLELVTATVLFFCTPIFATIFAGFMHGEHAGPRRWTAVIAGFIGVIIVLRPGYATIEPAMFAALGSAILFALALVQSRPLAQADGPFSTLFATVTITALVAFPVALPVWKMPDTGFLWILVVAIIATGIIRMVADLQAYRFGEAASLAPMSYLRLVIVAIAAYVLYNEVPDGAAMIGAAIIVGSAIYIGRREAAIKKRNSTAK